MAVRFILGTSGTGKTALCVRQVVEALLDTQDSRPLVLLVPEQATYQAERAILADERIPGYDRLYVLSFDRLSYFLLGKNTAKSTLSRIGREMIVQRLLRVHSDKLEVFSTAAERTGTARAIAKTISELHRAGTTAEDINSLIETLVKYDPDSLTALKFADIGLLFKEYTKFIAGKFTDPDVQLSLTRSAVAESPIIKSAKLWVDGFAGFTAAELAVLAELLRTASDTHIALCLDPKALDDIKERAANIDPAGLFAPTQKTYCDLVDIIKKCKLKIDRPVILNHAKRFDNCPPLAHLENEFGSLQPEQAKAGENVRLIAAADGRAEVRFVAGEILKLVKEKNYRYRDIAVIASDIDYYEHYLRACLEDYSIPFFIDKRKPLRQHPVISLVLSALEIVTGGFNRAEVFNYLKTWLTPLNSYEIDLLENYCIAFGLRDGDWRDTEKWDFAAEYDERFDNDRADEIRRRVAEPLIRLRSTLCSDDGPEEISAKEFADAVFGLLDKLGVRQRLNEWVRQALSEEDIERANYHRQFCEAFAETFDEMAEAFADIKMTCDEWRQVLEAAAGQMTLAFIPPRLDQVLVGSIERSRHPDLKAVFLIGCTQKQFPTPVSFDCVLTESDREAAATSDFALGPSARDELSQRQYLAYIAFTRPSQYLYVSYPLVDKKASATVCSRFVTRLQSLFEDLNIERIDSHDIDITAVNTAGELAQVICAGVGADAKDSEQKEQLQVLTKEMQTDSELAPVARTVNYALSYDNKAKLDKTITAELFPGPLRCSATRLSAFAACPYRHFAKYALGLEERKEFKFEPLDKGLFYHKVLDSVFKELNKQGLDFSEIEPSELLNILQSRIDVLLKEDSFINNFYTHTKHNAYIIKAACQSLEEFILAAARMAKAGDFKARLSEADFGDTQSDLGLCTLSCPDGRELFMNGKIDRIDIAEIKGQKFALVFDYKLSGRSFSWRKYYHGLDIQLGIYLLAVQKSGSAPVGAFYIPIEAPPKQTAFAKVDKQSDKFEYRANGIFDGQFADNIDREVQTGWSNFYNFGVSKKDGQYGYYGSSGALKPRDFETFLEFTCEKICNLTEEIVQGRIDVGPYRLNSQIPCTWCEFRPVCRFDWQINDYRVLEQAGKKDVIGSNNDD